MSEQQKRFSARLPERDRNRRVESLSIVLLYEKARGNRMFLLILYVYAKMETPVVGEMRDIHISSGGRPVTGGNNGALVCNLFS